MEKLTDHLIVISFDCLSEHDVPLLGELPNFKAFIDNSSFCTQVETIYPSVTYPCHATIVTGNFPNRHGIVNNTFVQPGKTSPDWYWHRRHIKGTTLFDEGKKAGMRTAALLWPVTAKADIDYNMPEIFANRPWHHQIPVSLSNGSPRYQLEMNAKFGHIRNGLSQPELDDFVLEATVETIRTRKPELMLIHFVDLDSQRHMHGFSSEEAKAALHRHDKRLGKIMNALKEAGIAENSTVIILGDHSALDESKVVKVNVIFKERGLIQTNASGKVINWKAYCKSCDGSAYVYVKDPNDDAVKNTVSDILAELLQDKSNGIEAAITGSEANAKGADGTAFRMLEAAKGYYFSEAIDGDYMEEVTEQDARTKKYTFACHGYSPEKEGYHTVFFAAGKGIRPGISIKSMHLADEVPTFARLLGLDLGDTDGSILEGILDI
ncbi:ectonucleotide pyrophosphatase/phosphodiesterase [Mesobacillus subterraneus]|uniref:alkaline phosphatase family protein n=1 Tax=Mesobacillus subterraneus TaxID=285983 RepID=UPI00274029A4|nr:ectonucleotide pyrophosphatase/phosphodiesterase [Mesobacillus subterraneus]WLR57209.1 ectonucleotide pyrophosphatase/phosphodiesterase [Mesobacillus subterraneus]